MQQDDQEQQQRRPGCHQSRRQDGHPLGVVLVDQSGRKEDDPDDDERDGRLVGPRAIGCDRETSEKTACSACEEEDAEKVKLPEEGAKRHGVVWVEMKAEIEEWHCYAPQG